MKLFRLMSWVLACCAACTAVGAQAQSPALYKSVGPDGKVVYSDRPPADGRIEKTLKFDNLPASALSAAAAAYAEQLKKAKLSTPVEVPQGVTLFSASWCGYCKLAKAYLGSKGITYQEIDIDTKAGIAALVQAGGGKGVPLLLSGKERVQGFSAPAYDAIFSAKK